MRENDGRKLSHETLEQIRIRAVKRVEAGESPTNVIRTLGFSRGRIYEWLAAYRGGGVEALRAKPIPGRPVKLSIDVLNFVYETVTTGSPLQTGFASPLWTREMVRELIWRRFGIRVSKTSVVRLLSKLGLSPQRPLHPAYRDCAELPRTWMQQQYPEILKNARTVGAEIVFVAEPTVAGDGNLISAIDFHGKLRFMFAAGALNADVYVDFLKRLLLEADRPVLLIVADHPAHRAAAVGRLAAQANDRFRLRPGTCFVHTEVRSGAR